MPTLLPPLVVAPLSECSKEVRVQNQLSGSVVEVLANGVHVGGGPATWSDQVFPLTSPILAGQKITARQKLGPDTSAPTPAGDAVEVQAKPAVIGHVGFSSPLYVCGECLHMDGLVPGATVDVKLAGNPAGSGTAYDGTARVHLSMAIPFGQPIVAQQHACGTAGLVTNSPAPDLYGGKREGPLPAPAIATPLYECQTSVTVYNVLPGATVTVTRSMGAALISCFDYSNEHFDGIPPLKLGEVLTATQAFPKCQRTSPASAPVKAVKAQPVPSPVVQGPLCADTTIVEVQGLISGAQVRLLQNGAVLGLGQASAGTVDFVVPSPGLTAGATITAEQELCNVWSAPSAGVHVDPKPAHLNPTKIPGPLYECASIVRVTNIRPGASVFVYSQALGEIGWKQVFGTWADIPVAPQLIKGDKIFAVEIACGLTSVKSNIDTVLAAPKLGLPIVEGPVEDSMRSVTVGNVVPGARVDVEVNGLWAGVNDAGAATVEVPLNVLLNAGDILRARQRLCSMITGYGEPTRVVSHVAFSYLTEHFDSARTGWNPHESTLTVANVSSPNFKKLFNLPVDGQTYAQPLYMHHVNVPWKGVHNVLYVATENNTVYAFDADGAAAPLWQKGLSPAGETPVSTGDIEGCDNVAPTIGITSTPVIDWRSYTLYVVCKTKKVSGGNTSFHHYLYALDLASGNNRPHSPMEILPSFPGSGQPNDGHGNVMMNQQWQMNRIALLLLNGSVFVGFGSHCDAHPNIYHGWVASFNAATLAYQHAFASTPDGTFGGIWQGGVGLAADPAGFIYCTTGNGDFNANTGGANYSDTVLKLTQQLAVSSWFTPADQKFLFKQDIDLGSGGVLVLPDGLGAPSNHPNLLVTCGKDGNIMVLDRANLGGFNNIPGLPDNQFGTNPNAKQTFLIKAGIAPGDQAGVWGGPAFYNGGAGNTFLYYCGSGGPLIAFALAAGVFSPAMVGGNPNQSDVFPAEGGTTPVVSSNGTAVGSAIVWAVGRRHGAGVVSLRAYDATNLTHKLFDQDSGPWANPDGGAFIEPTVVRGKVYLGSDNTISVYGL